MKVTLEQRYEALREILHGYTAGVAIAFSGGVDSTFLLRAARDTLGAGRVAAITARSAGFPARELREAVDYCAVEGVRHVICDAEELLVEGLAANPVNRCYLCKSALFLKICAIARELGLGVVAEGSNLDDTGDYRPGMAALAEQGIRSPLREAGLTKADIRALSREWGLPTWDKPALACLFTRIPYGEAITEEKLRQIDAAELLLLELGLRQVRVRHHGTLACIETDEAGMALLAASAVRERVYAAFKTYGFTHTAVDMLGYRTGSMNEGVVET